ncbi:hypothetical protein BKA67DRAFT_530488 [Truncatella angustata]|uniref:Uncharacterized protein n=1 Tax=Truncatella angustata TaxID=152316 RepID=A0A9P9A275_9PEZI|nr:uncharacterized protein BKA67DRAFT_530488 [Truncatella angustata]KAH6660391.1 hypothetical protein BKA67DRAFT_530488 [Truncatella angustata]
MIRAASKQCLQSLPQRPVVSAAALRRGFASGKPEPSQETQAKEQISQKDNASATEESKQAKPSGRKTMAELDEEVKLKLAGLAGDGGEAGVEYEDGQPVAMKRSVKNNMFRYI